MFVTPLLRLFEILFLTIFLIVNVESEGPYEPERLLPEAIKVMREKLAIIKQAAKALRNKSTSLDSDVIMADAWCASLEMYLLVFESPVRSGYFVPKLVTETLTGYPFFQNQK